MLSETPWRWLRPLLLALASAVGVVLMWWAFVLTVRGQGLDVLGYNGANLGSWLVAGHFDALLSRISVAGVAVVMALVALVALLRRRWLLALEAAVLIGGADLTTQVLKYRIFYRPELRHLSWFENNSYPSGHTTAATSAIMAAVLVAPPALRSATAVLGSLGTVLFGYGTLAAHWHRPSDVVGGYLVCLAWSFAVLAVSAVRQRMLGRIRGEEPDPERPSRLVPVLMVLASLVAFAVAAVCGHLVWNVGDPTNASHHELFLGYLGSSAGICGVAVAGMGVLLRLVQLHDAGRRAA